MKDIGSQLKEAREKKKLSVHDVAVATKINNKTIQAIEDGDIENLPAKPFLRGFIQTYARYLELNVDEIMKSFLEAHGSTKPKPVISEEGKSDTVSHEEIQNKFELYKKFAYVGAAIFAVIFIYVIQRVVSKYEQESKIAKEQKEAVKSQLAPEQTTPAIDVKEEEPKAPETPSTPSTTATPTTSTGTTVNSTPTVTPTVTPSTVTTPPTPALKPQETKPAEVKPAEVKPVEAKPAEQKSVETKPAEVKPTETKPTEKTADAKPQQVIIEALDNVEIRYTKDGEGERTVKLKPEQFLTIKANTKVSLNISDSGAVNIIHNGRDKGVPGNLGQPTKISYP